MLTKTLRFDEKHHDDIIYPNAIGFLFVHVACLGILWSGVTLTSVLLCVGLYFGWMFAITAGFHRYFSHRTFKTSRFFQFVLAFLAQSSLQRGVLWWSAKHRHHHKYSDTPEDVHSPGIHGFFFAHVGWIFSRQRGQADYSLVRDLSEYPELVWLDKHEHLPGVLVAVICFLIAGWPGLFMGFFLSNTLHHHGTFAINSLAHTFGRQRYLTGDDSRNSFLLALITMGEGWHNNHHYYQASTRQGWRWWEIDPTYYVLKALSWTGLVWDLKAPPKDVLAGERRLSRKAIEKVAHQVVATFSIEKIAEQARATWAHAPSMEDLQAVLPHLPSLEELKRRAESMAMRTPSLDDIVERARDILIEAISVRLLEEPLPATG